MAGAYHILCTVVDLRTLVRHTYVLGELRRFYAEPVSIGSDPGCDIILDDPEVLPRHAVLTAASNHRMVKILAPGGEGSRRHDGRPISIGPFGLVVVESTEVIDVGAPPVELAVRFGAKRNLATTTGGAPRATPVGTETRRLFAALASADFPATAPALRWCATQIETHFERLSRATAPRPALHPTHIECHGSLARACERWAEQWAAAESQPFAPQTWAYVHRLAAWIANGRSEHRELWDLQLALARLGRWGTAKHLVAVDAIVGIAAAHLATLDDLLSPIRPLVALAERGVFAFALPDAGMLLYVSSLDATDRVLLPSMDEAEGALSVAVAQRPSDHQQRLVYADLLEQRGRASAAARMRAAAAGAGPGEPSTRRVEDLFAAARPVLLPREGRAAALGPVQPSGSPPAAHLTLGTTSFALAAVTALHWTSTGAVEVRELSSAVASSKPGATITSAGGTLWIRALDYRTVALNDVHLDNETDTPLFDGDILCLGTARLVVNDGS